MASRPLRVLVTASGSPGGGRLVRSLRENRERPMVVIGTDMSERRGGRMLCDRFHVVPPGSSDEFAPALIDLAEREEVDVVFPLSSFEVAAVASVVDQFGRPVLVSHRSRSPPATTSPARPPSPSSSGCPCPARSW